METKSLLPTQFGTASEADFSENTWTFIMPDEYQVTAGEFAIIPKETYDALLIAAEIGRRIEEDFDEELSKEL